MATERTFARLAALDSLAVGAAIFVRARALEFDADAVLLADASGQRWVRARCAVAYGAYIEGRVERSAGELVLHDVLVHALAAGSIHPDGDVRKLLARPGRLARIEARARCIRTIRAFFDARASVEVETPTLVANPGMDVHLDAFRVDGAGERWLATSPEYAMKRLVAAGMERIHQITRAYRRDEVGALHEPEFTILEWYRAFASADDVMRETEELVADVVAASNGGATRIVRNGTPIDFAPPWDRLTVRDALDRHGGFSLDALLADEARLFEVLGTIVQPQLGTNRPIWLVDWPIALASLARPKDGDPSVAERFEAYVAGIELCNGFCELTDAAEQRRRFEADLASRRALGKDLYPIDERFLRALEDGLPPCSGNAVGVDRIVMIATGAETLADARTFSVDDV